MLGRSYTRPGACLGAVFWPATVIAQTSQSPAAQSPAAQETQPQAQGSAKPAAPSTTAHNVVTVTAAPEQAVRTSIDRRSYSVANDLQGSGGTIADALRNIPGAEVDVNGNLSLRGGAVQIMIDGQPSLLFDGQAGAQALQSMPADRIDRVEVITTPTAAFSPEGQAGIINLVTKKTAPAGASGGVRANMGGAGRENIAGNWVYTKDKLTVTADGGWRRDVLHFATASTGAEADPVTGLPDPRTQNVLTKGFLDSWNGHLGFDYQIDPKTRLSGETRYNTFKYDRDQDYSLLSDAPNGSPLTAYSQTGRIDAWQGIALGQMTLRHEFPGQNHTLVLFYNHTQIHYMNDNASNDLTTVPPPPLSEFEDQFEHTNRDGNQFKADYTRPMPGSAQLKLGYEFSVSKAAYNNFGVIGTDQPQAAFDPVLSNLFLYRLSVNAAYMTYERPFKALTVLVGLRVEDEQLQLGQVTQAEDVSHSYLDVFPSLHLAYKTSATTQWVLSYASRIQRPQPFDLNPFRNLADPFNISEGNPNLKPQTTQSFEGGWQYRKGPASYLATLFYRQNEHGLTSVTTNLSDGVLFTQRENLVNSKTGGLELVAAAPLSKSLTYNLSTDVYWNQIQAPILGGALQTRQDVTISGRGNISWQPTKSDLAQVNAQVNAASLTPTGHNDPLFILFFGYRHKFTDNFALVTTLVDPFDSIRQNSYVETIGIDTHTVTRPFVRTAYIGFTWTFGGHGRAQRDQGIDFDAGASVPSQ